MGCANELRWVNDLWRGGAVNQSGRTDHSRGESGQKFSVAHCRAVSSLSAEDIRDQVVKKGVENLGQAFVQLGGYRRAAGLEKRLHHLRLIKAHLGAANKVFVAHADKIGIALQPYHALDGCVTVADPQYAILEELNNFHVSLNSLAADSRAAVILCDAMVAAERSQLSQECFDPQRYPHQLETLHFKLQRLSGVGRSTNRMYLNPKLLPLMIQIVRKLWKQETV